ncbi:MAG: glutaminase A [Gemmatimonadota bacterium]
MKTADNRDSIVTPITSVSRRSRFKLSRYGQEESLRLLLAEAELDALQGRVADYIPELRRANAEDQGISLCFLDGAVVSAGVAHQTFTIQSISKTIALLYVLESLGSKQVFSRVGKEPTGEPFNSGLSFQVGSKRPTNPMINAGAIVVSSMFPGGDPDQQFKGFLRFIRKVCGNPNLEIQEDVYRSEKATGHNNRSLAWIMNDRRVFLYKRDIPPVEYIEGVLEVYFQQCSIGVTAGDLGRCAALLANLGVDPVTGERIAIEEHVTMVLALMASCGLYDGSGTFAAKIGVPAKSGVGGGIMAAIPGRLGIATYGPALDSAGNSCFGLYALERIAVEENLSLLSGPPNLSRFSRRVHRSSDTLDELAERAGLEATSGQVARYIPELAKVLPEHRAVSLCSLDGVVIGGGEHADFEFTIQSVCVPLLLSYLLRRLGTEFVFSRFGSEPTGEPFDANPKWVEIDHKQWPFNPVTNVGAILLASMLPGDTSGRRRDGFLSFVRQVCKNAKIEIDEAVYQSELGTGEKNRRLAWELVHKGCFEHRVRPEARSQVEYVEEIISDYFFACSLKVTCDDLARFCALLAAQGEAPAVSSVRLARDHVSQVVTLMSSCGIYDGSGEYAFAVGLPSKSGVSGGIIAVAPGKLGLAAFCSAVDSKGASVAARYMIEEISRAERLSVYLGEDHG